eukprot:gene11695-12913_t
MAEVELAAAAYLINFDTDEEIMLPIMNENVEKNKNPQFPYWNYPRFSLETVTEDDCLAQFRFERNDLPRLAEALRIPQKVVCPNGTVANERGQAWTTIAKILNSSASPKFKVTQRLVREKLEKMMQNFRQKDAHEQRANRINAENDEINQALAEIADRMAEFGRLWSQEKEQANEKAELEASQAEEVRRKATERLGQTMDRLSQKEKRERRCSTEALEIVNESLKVKKQHLERDLGLCMTQELAKRKRQVDETRQCQQMQIR